MTYPYETATEEQKKIGAWWWCVHHDIHCEPLQGPIEGRAGCIAQLKPKTERKRRFAELRPVKRPERLPARLKNAWAKYENAASSCNMLHAGHPEELAATYRAWAKCVKALAGCEPELMALHREEYPDTKWNGKTIFGDQG